MAPVTSVHQMSYRGNEDLLACSDIVPTKHYSLAL